MRDYWEEHDRAAHAHSRQGFVAGPYGGCFPFPADAPPPALRPRWPGKGVVLPEPRALAGLHVTAKGEKLPLDLGAVLDRRESKREPKGCDARDLAALLDLFRVRERIDGAGGRYEALRKRLPSGGAMHSLECYAALRGCEGLQDGLWWYSPADGDLVMVSGMTTEWLALLEGGSRSAGVTALPVVLLILASRFARVMWKYRRMCLATIHKDCGAAMMGLALVATALDLHATPLGGGDAELFSRATGLDPWEEGSVGELAVW